MSNKVNGLWAVNSDGVFMFFNSVDSPSVWRFGMSGDVESWRMVPGVGNAQAVRGVAAVYRAEGGVWLDPNGADYAQAVREIGDVPSIVERGGLIMSDDCGDYTAHGLSLPDVDRERGWVLSWEHGGMVVSRDVSFLTPAEQDHPDMCETYDDLPAVAQSVEVVEPEPVTPEPVSRSQQPMSELGGHTIVEFAREFEAIYTMLYDSDVSPADYGDAVSAFADGEYPMNVLEAFDDYREDFVSSEREAAAFMMALQSKAMQPEPVETVDSEVVEPEPVTAEIPEVPPQTEPHEVVATSSAIMVRKMVIPGGKSIKELSDVFGAYVHKPRGFRDSKGRRVAYVAFDGTGGVIAYRDYYTQGVDTRLEEQIADYLAAHNLKLAA